MRLKLCAEVYNHMNEQERKDLAELIQDDLITILDGQPQELITACCQAVVNRILCGGGSNEQLD